MTTPFDFTEQQKSAILTHDKNLIVVAGAGSGKTRVLVERYLKLLEANPAWPLNALVAITFTREAALEMRNRVRKELETRLHSAPTPKAKRWSDLLAQMDSARIDTIHGLCATILRANAAEAGIDPRFEVLEPIDGAALLTDVIDGVLRELVGDPDDDTATLFAEYDMRAIRTVLTNPNILMADLADMPLDADGIFQMWEQDWQANYGAARKRFKQDPQLIAAWDWSPPSWPSDDKIMAIYQALDDQWTPFFEETVSESCVALDNMQKSILLRGGAAAKWGGKDILAEAKENLGVIRDLLKAFKDMVDEPPNDTDKRAAEMLVRWYRLIAKVRDAYQAEKEVHSYLDFNDLESKTAHLLNTRPAVRDRYQGVEFKQLLVDEFQDTNEAQWKIVTSLANIDDDVAMFVVGDQKQSIYGFRGADVSVFDEARDIIGEQIPAGEEVPLSVSFRSHPGLIETFNALFSQILTKNPASPVAKYEIGFVDDTDAMTAHRQPLLDEAKAYYSSLELLLVQTETRGGLSSDKLRQWEAYEIAERLKKLKTEQAPIFDKSDEDGDIYRAFDYGDAAILFQTTTHITIYEDVLKALDIPFVTVAGRGYYNRQEVWDMLNLLKALHSPTDNLSLAAALRSPMFGFSDEILLALRRLRDESQERPSIIPLWDALSADDIPVLDVAQLERIRFARDILHELRDLAGRVTISELLRRSLSKTGYLATLTGLSGGARLRRNVEKLIDIAEASGKITLGAFSHYLDDLTSREVREGEAVLDASGAVRLMTVHASKGLEFPIVVLADASRQLRDMDNDVLLYDRATRRYVCKIYDADERKHIGSYAYRYAKMLKNRREEAEHKRLLYVAATRARDSLIMAGSIKVKKNGEWSISGWLEKVLMALELEKSYDLHDGYTFDYTQHATIKLHLPKYNEALPQKLRQDDGIFDWKVPKNTVQPQKPPRLQPIVIERERLLGHLAATQLAGIGGFYYAQSTKDKIYFRDTVRRQVLADAATQIREAVRVRDPRIKSRQIGEIVHEALRYWRFADNTKDIHALLESYAWQQNITDPHDVREVVQKALNLLKKFQSSDIYREMVVIQEKGHPFYTELPFIFRTDKRIIHGVIDVLYQRDDGTWVLIDYKTSYLRGMKAEDHARRYHLQVGAYASAAREELGGIVPDVYIYYIQRQEKVEIPANVWQTEIQKLEKYIGELITYD